MKRFELQHDVLAKIIEERVPRYEHQLIELHQNIESTRKPFLSLTKLLTFHFKGEKLKLSSQGLKKVENSNRLYGFLGVAVFVLSILFFNEYEADKLVRRAMLIQNVLTESERNLDHEPNKSLMAVREVFNQFEEPLFADNKEYQALKDIKTMALQIYYDSPPFYQEQSIFQKEIISTDLSLNGQYMICASRDSFKIFEIDYSNTHCISRLLHERAYYGKINSVKFSEDNKYFVIATEKNAFGIGKMAELDSTNFKLWYPKPEISESIQKAYITSKDFIISFSNSTLYIHCLADHPDSIQISIDTSFSISPPIKDIAYNSAHQFLAVPQQKKCFLWDLAGRQRIKKLHQQKNYSKVYFTRFSSSGNNLIAVSKRDMSFWKSRNDNQAFGRMRKNISFSMSDAKFSPKEDYLIISSPDKLIRIYKKDLEDGAYYFDENRRGIGHSNKVIEISTSEDNRLFATNSLDRSPIVWDYHGDIIARLPQYSESVTQLMFGRQSKRLFVTYDDGTLRIFYLNKYEVLEELPEALAIDERCRINSEIVQDSFFGNVEMDTLAKLICPHPDSSYIVSILEGEPKATIIRGAHESEESSLGMEHVKTIDFSPNGHYMVLIAKDSELAKLFCIRDENGMTLPKYIATLSGHIAPLDLAKFDKESQYIVTKSSDGEIKKWIVDIDSLATQIDSLYLSPLTEKEREKYELELLADDLSLTSKIKKIWNEFWESE